MIGVPLSVVHGHWHPEQAAIVSSPRIFNDLTAPATHGLAPDDIYRRVLARWRNLSTERVEADV